MACSILLLAAVPLLYACIRIETKSISECSENSTTSDGTSNSSELQEYFDESNYSDANERILRGRYARKGEIPFVVALSNAADQSYCGGSIMSNYYVLTACHCVAKSATDVEGKPILVPKSYENFRVIAGSLSRNPPEDQGYQLRWVFHWFHHPQCEMNNYGEIIYDAGIIKVTEQFHWTECVQPAKIPTQPQNFSVFVDTLIEVDHQCYAAGWGATVTKLVDFETPLGTHQIKEKVLNVSRYLKTLDSELLHSRVCYKAKLCKYVGDLIQKNACVKKLRQNGTPRLCAWSRSPGNGTTCFGDSGGPLVCNGFLIGLVSYGARCYPMNEPVVFTRVDKIFPFIARYYYASAWYSLRMRASLQDVSRTVLLFTAAHAAFQLSDSFS